MSDESNKERTQDEQNRVLFMQLVVMLATSAMQQMGKLTNPATGQVEVNMDAAEASIDFLDMLRIKTSGNLDAQEERVLADSLHSLRMNYWETRQSRTNETPQQSAPEETPAPPPANTSTTDSGKKPEEHKEPRFHKKYN